MANYIEDFNSKLDWAMPFQRTGKFPIDRTNLFSTYNDAVAYAKGDGSDSRGLGGTSYVGQLIVVFENDVVTAYKINANRTIEALTSSSGVDAEILDLQTQLNSEIAARKAVDGQNGQTYSANTGATYISGATSLNDADIKLNNAITAETKARQDAVNAMNTTIENTNGNLDISVVQTNGLLASMTISDIALSDDYSAITYPSVDSVTFTPAEAGDILDSAIEKLDKNIATLVQEVLNNENVVAAALTKHNESAGFDENANYIQNTNANFISNATTLSEADDLLDAALQNAIEYLESEIDNLGEASSSDLDDEIAARKAVDGQSGQTYSANTGATYISGATSLNDADIKLSNAISNLRMTEVTGTELSGLGTNVKEAYKLIDGNNTKHGDYIKIYKDSSLKTVVFEDQTLKFTYIYSDGSEDTVDVDVSAFLTENEYADGLQVVNHVISVKRDANSESFLSISADGIKLSGVQEAINNAVNNLDSNITSDDVALVTVQVKQTDGKISDVIVTGNDVDCGTF